MTIIKSNTLNKIYFPTRHIGFSASFYFKYKLFGFIPVNGIFSAETNHSALNIDVLSVL